MKLLKGYENWLILIDKESREKMSEWWGPIVNQIITINGKEFEVKDSVGHKDLAYKRAISMASRVGWYIGTKNCNDIAPTIDVRVVRNEKEE